METFKFFQIRVPYRHANRGYYMEVWNDDDASAPPQHTFETGEPVWLHSDMMGRTEFPIWWITIFERSTNNEWFVRLRSDRVENVYTDYHESLVHNLVALPPMLRIALEASD